MKNEVKSVLAGIAAVAAYASVALAQGGGFDCVVDVNATTCYACSGCTIGPDNEPNCGTVEAAATCPGNQQPDCSVSVGPNGTTYTAKCGNRNITPVGPVGIF